MQSSVCQSSPQTCDYVRQLQPNLKRAFTCSESVIYHLLFSSATTWFLYQTRQWTVIACVPFLCVFFSPQNAKELSKSSETLDLPCATVWHRFAWFKHGSDWAPGKCFKQPLHGMLWTAVFRSQGCHPWTIQFWQEDVKLQLCESNSYYSLLKHEQHKNSTHLNTKEPKLIVFKKPEVDDGISKICIKMGHWERKDTREKSTVWPMLGNEVGIPATENREPPQAELRKGEESVLREYRGFWTVYTRRWSHS